MTDKLLGRTFGDFRVDRLIGRGSVGRVYAATQLSLKRAVALKVLEEGLFTPDEFKVRFQREAEVIAALEHPHIVPIYAFGQEGNYAFYAMRFVEGRNLEELMTEGLPLRDALRYLADVAGALEYAHGRGVVHRDLKPANILVSAGQAMLSDFGLARMIESATLTESGQLVGTPLYMAPEQARREKVGPPADVFALGIVLYEIAEGRHPFSLPDGEDLKLRVLKRISDADFAPPTSALSDLILALMEPDPADRPARPRELLLDALARAKPGPPPPPREPAPSEPTKRFGKFQILDQLGHGGMGAVFRARQTDLKRDVALKVMNFGPDADANAVERFRREAQAVARLRHPNIIAVHEAGEIDGRPYFSMDLVEGQSLSNLLENGPPPVRRSMEIMRDVAAAIGHAHAESIVHRDLKPANILLDAEGRVFVADFGLAKSVNIAGTQLTQSGEVMGTPAYMAPEQAKGSSGLIDPRTDVYGMGAVLYHLLTGWAPFDGANMYQVLSDVIATDPPSPRSRNARIHADAETICLKAMEKDPARRYKGASDFKADVERFLAGEPIEARPIGGLSRVYRRLKRRPAIVALAAAIVVLLAVGAGLLIAQQSRHKRQAEARELTREAAMFYLAHDYKEVESRARRAVDVDPSWGPGWFWLARLDLRRYAEGLGVPAVWVSYGELEFNPMKRESPQSAALRARALESLDRARNLDGMKDWEGDFARAVALFFAENYADARAAFDALKSDVPDRELDAYRALSAYYARDFSRALDTVRAAVDRWGPAEFRAVHVNALLAVGLALTLRGEDPSAFYTDALNAATDPVDKARVLTHQGDWESGRGGDAESKYRAAIATSDAPLARGDALLGLARVLEDRGAIDPDHPAPYLDALASFDAAVDESDPSPGALFRRAEARTALVNFLSAWGRSDDVPAMMEARLRDFERVLASNPAYVDARLDAAVTRCAIRRATSSDRLVEHPKLLRDLVGEVERCVRDHPNRARGHVVLGYSYKDLARLDLASGRDPFDAFEKALASFARARGNVNALLAYAGALTDLQSVHAGHPYYDRKKSEEFRDRALAEYDRALALNPREYLAMVGAAASWIESANVIAYDRDDPSRAFDEAARWLDRAEGAHLRPVAALVRRATLEKLRGRLDAAEAALRKALAFNERNARVLRDLAVVLADRSEYGTNLDLLEQAIDVSVRAIKEFKHDADAWADHGRYLVLHGRVMDADEARRSDFDAAVQSCDEALKRSPGHHVALLYKGIALVERGLRDPVDARQEKDLLAAVDALELATAQFAGEFEGLVSLAYARSGLGLLLNERGDAGKPHFDKAVAAYRAAQKIQPLPVHFQVELCRCLVLAERWDEAETLLPSLPADNEMVRALKKLIEKHRSDF